MKFVMICCLYFLCSVSLIFSQNGEKSKGNYVPKKEEVILAKKKSQPGDYVSTAEFKSSFRYVIIDSDLQFDDEGGKMPARHYVKVLMEERAFNKANLTYLFSYLSAYFNESLYLGIDVHTSLMTLQTPEEGAAASPRERFRLFYKTAGYTRSNDIHERCSASFLYDTGRPGKFIRKSVEMPCLSKK